MVGMGVVAAFLWGLISDIVLGPIKGWISDFISRKFTRISDPFWERFLPPDYRDILRRSVSTVLFSTNKELYYRLCNSPILLDGGKMFIHGKLCRFSDVAEHHQSMCWLDIQGKKKRRELSPKTLYAAYLVFKIAEKSHGLESLPAKASVILIGAGGGVGVEHEPNTVYLESKPSSNVPRERQQGQRPRERKDGWIETEMGVFFTYEGDYVDEVEMRLMGIEFLNRDSGLIIQGIELRPKEGCLIVSDGGITDKTDGWLNSIKHFRMAAKPDTAWERFNLSDYQDILKRSVSPLVFSTKKELYFLLCDFPILLDEGKMSFALEKKSGKKCYMLSATELSIGGDERYWKWTSHVDYRFLEVPVAELLNTNWLEIRGKMNTRWLSPKTTYVAYLVFRISENSYGIKSVPLRASVRFVGAGEGRAEERTSSVYLESDASSKVPHEHQGQLPRERKDGWMEIEIGEFFNNQGDDGEVEMLLMEIERLNKKSGLIVQGIELRPKPDDSDGWISSLWQFKFASDSDTMWKRFLPSDYSDIIARSGTPLVFSSNKELFDQLCNSPILLDLGTMSFVLDKRSGRKCFMLGARGLSIKWGDNTKKWKWISQPYSRLSEAAKLLRVHWVEIRGKMNNGRLSPKTPFSEVAKLPCVHGLEIGGKMNTKMLSPTTRYGIYLVFKIAEEFEGIDSLPIKAIVRFVGAEGAGGAKVETVTVYLKSETSSHLAAARQLPQEREDGWMEIKMGEHFNDQGVYGGELEMRLVQLDCHQKKSGLIVQGIELRPKNGDA